MKDDHAVQVPDAEEIQAKDPSGSQADMPATSPNGCLVANPALKLIF